MPKGVYERTPEMRAKTSAATRAAMARPEVRAKLIGPHTPEHVAKTAAANRGKTRSLEHRAQMSAAMLVHGHSGSNDKTGTKSRTYQSWGNMKARCANPNSPSWRWYGGRGITVCDRWAGPHDFPNFLADMGERPDWADGGIDRIDNDGNYEPDNCRWATRAQQLNNRRPVADRTPAAA